MTFLLCTGCGVLTDNYHSVSQGKELPIMYRSAQMKPERLQRAIREQSVDTVLNLRGESPEKDWYREEVNVCKDTDTEHLSIKMSAYKRPSKEKVLRLISILEQAKKQNKTVLLHCQGGADRSGFASAVAQMVVYDKSAQQALNSFSIWYGCLLFYIPLDEIIEEYQAYEKKMSFREWVENVYVP
ncbi:phosphatase domain-containing protein [Candidatus Uabimicrobium amorphum]|nr:tyrosine-protein phosphatase [Candidatus Uabimicrobium amorphum]